MEMTLIRITKKQQEIMDKIKVHPRETYSDIIERLLSKVSSHIKGVKELGQPTKVNQK